MKGKQFPQSFLKLARFAGVTKSEFLDNKQLTGNAFDLYDEAMKFLHFTLPIAGKIPDDSPYRVDTPAIPLKVLREALVNAFCHRDYSIPGGSIAVAVYDDRVEIGSTGLLPRGVKVSQLSKEHLSVPRNKLISDAFFICHMIERWGRGTQDMIELCKQSGNPIPRFEEVTGSLLVTLPLKEHLRQFAMPIKQEVKLDGLTSRQQEILKILKSGPMGASVIMGRLKDAVSARVLQKELSSLSARNFVIKSGGSRGRFVKWALNQ